MRLQKILNRFLRLHPKEIDLSLDRINKLLAKLNNPQNQLKNVISVVGTNGKYSTIQAIRSFCIESGLKCNLYLSPHIQKINERFVYNNKEISDDNLTKLLEEVDDINNGDPITYFEILTSAFFLGASKSSSDITILESGLFHRYDACSVIKKNLASVITSTGLDHLEWLPDKERTIDRIIYEKTSNLLKSKIIVSEQSNQQILDKIEKSIEKNSSKKVIFKKNFNYSLGENNFFYYEDQFGGLKLPYPNLLGKFQISNISTAIATVRSLEQIKINDENIKSGITNIKSTARLQEIKKGKLKKLSINNTLLIDGSHNPLGAWVLKEYLNDLGNQKKIYMIVGMMNNKDHKKYISYFKNKVESITAIDIPNQKNSAKKENLKEIINESGINSNISENIESAIKSISKKNYNSIILISGSLYLVGEVLNLN